MSAMLSQLSRSQPSSPRKTVARLRFQSEPSDTRTPADDQAEANTSIQETRKMLFIRRMTKARTESALEDPVPLSARDSFVSVDQEEGRPMGASKSADYKASPKSLLKVKARIGSLVRGKASAKARSLPVDQEHSARVKQHIRESQDMVQKEFAKNRALLNAITKSMSDPFMLDYD
eukprot:TRINITY_DN22177_c0_g1_i2.p1 TRINITY_DN22177_c0_g1~~TRINITY_DN22177_c0_g1_i2.p1  ORF type:complete len:176 (-),score=29.29 TRINITY_DN22177_c0_g1_i2:89-616(-)